MKSSRAILSFALASLVLFSGSNVVIGLHLCGGQVQNIALFDRAEVCDMEKQMPPCHRHLGNTCCDDETFIHDGEDFNLPPSGVSISMDAPLILENPAMLIAEVIPTSPVSRRMRCMYDPPLRAGDLNISLHTFLI